MLLAPAALYSAHRCRVWRTPAQALADGALVDGDTYSYFAVDDPTNPTQREWGHSVYTALTETFTRVVLGGVNGNTDTGTSPINFSQRRLHPSRPCLTQSWGHLLWSVARNN
jgi:hypothetical protein